MPQKKAQRPRRVRILNLSWTIEFVDKAISTASDALGWCDYGRQTISLFEDQSNESMADTFHHEILHAVFYAMGIDPQNCDEENIVQRISTGMCTVWSNNPLAFRWFQSLL